MPVIYRHSITMKEITNPILKVGSDCSSHKYYFEFKLTIRQMYESAGNHIHWYKNEYKTQDGVELGMNSGHDR